MRRGAWQAGNQGVEEAVCDRDPEAAAIRLWGEAPWAERNDAAKCEREE